ncbi:nuclease-related domain-containing protein [Planococcus sp. 1R117A]|uniref:nuclease-related domain-containing protein n=1 Tax=Planococcus sp. 1R117A TaxID=3447020 RepID=UPI003EDBC197
MLSETEALESLLNRLPETHSYRKFLEVKLYRSKAGNLGEARIKKKFKEFYSEEEHHVMWDVSLSIGDWKVQIDGLLLTANCAVIIESKNISGKIFFDEDTEEFYRFDEKDEKTVMEDPVIQLNKHIRFLETWFKKNKIKLSVDGVVVFTPKQCEFMSKPKDKHICKTYQMVEYLHSILQEYPQGNTSLKITKIRKVIESNTAPYQRIPLCEYYRIDIADLKSGVYCPICEAYSMKRQNRSWQCNLCKRNDPLAREFAVQEYFSLISRSLTNQHFRRFCDMESQPVATRLLGTLNLEKTGELKGREYKLKV